MLSKSTIVRLLVAGWFALLSSGSAAPKQASELQKAPTIRVQPSLVLVDVLSFNPKDGLPVRDFKKEDFRLFDNSDEVQISTFDAGALYNTRPVIIWLTVICNEQNKVGAPQIMPGGKHCSGPRSNDLDAAPLPPRIRIHTVSD